MIGQVFFGGVCVVGCVACFYGTLAFSINRHVFGRCHTVGSWKKYDAINVTGVTWKDVKKESFGGVPRACHSEGVETLNVQQLILSASAARR